MPLAILEAMSSGLPCIVTDIPGNNDLIENNFNGLLFPIEDYIALSKCIEKLVQDPILRNEFAKNSRELSINNFSLKRRNDRMIELYQR